MKHLEFKDKFRDKIFGGEKIATLRLFTRLKKGDLAYIHCGGEIIGIAEIVDVVEKSIEELSDEDAKLDGFKDREELIEELRKFYGFNLPDKISIIKFRLLSKMSEKPYNIHYGSAELVDIAKKALKYLDLNKKDREILELFLKYRSVRKVALKLGSLKKRGVVRKTLRESYRELKRQGLM